MPSVRAIEDAFQQAVDRALCRVSREPLRRIEAQGNPYAVRRINQAMAELEKLIRGEEQPDYRHRDVALFYSQWYLPEQINVTYSESVRVLGRSRSRRADRLQLVDFGAGTGAMAIGLSLAIATHMRREYWPGCLSVYQVDHPAMLEFGQEIWHAILDEASGALALRGVAEVMSRTKLRHLTLDDNLDYEVPPLSNDAERWLTAIHVAYEGSMEKINAEVQSLCASLRPHVSIRTVPWRKKHHLKGRHLIRLRLDDDVVPKITLLRKNLNDRTTARHPFLYEWVGWEGGDSSSKAHYAATACRSGAEWHA
jgi:hypothetical protein